MFTIEQVSFLKANFGEQTRSGYRTKPLFSALGLMYFQNVYRCGHPMADGWNDSLIFLAQYK